LPHDDLRTDRDRRRRRARRVPIAEHVHLFVDDEGNVRCDHALKLWGILAVRLHYRLTRG
jgi:hypothetical protein